MASSFREPNRARWVGVRPAHDGTHVYNKADASNSTIVVYTVPAGKVFCLTVLHMSSRGTAAAAETFAHIRNAADVIAVTPLDHYYAVAGQLCDTINFWPPFEMPAGWDIAAAASNANSWAAVTVDGWIEDE